MQTLARVLQLPMMMLCTLRCNHNVRRTLLVKIIGPSASKLCSRYIANNSNLVKNICDTIAAPDPESQLEVRQVVLAECNERLRLRKPAAMNFCRRRSS